MDVQAFHEVAAVSTHVHVFSLLGVLLHCKTPASDKFSCAVGGVLYYRTAFESSRAKQESAIGLLNSLSFTLLLISHP